MPGFGILALRIRSLAAWRDRRLSPMGFGGAETGSCAANPFLYPPLAPSVRCHATFPSFGMIIVNIETYSKRR